MVGARACGCVCVCVCVFCVGCCVCVRWATCGSLVLGCLSGPGPDGVTLRREVESLGLLISSIWLVMDIYKEDTCRILTAEGLNSACKGSGHGILPSCQISASKICSLKGQDRWYLVGFRPCLYYWCLSPLWTCLDPSLSARSTSDSLTKKVVQPNSATKRLG